ncbi:SPFH domain-containing protein [Falsiroseomonas stagni]|uniref:Regulator of protease activity HflC, stomatin/prohibitin superfamily n=1 Tax=Falsiroseomonas stagni DSM 19981 TaxID=1123062 RepID=A0A1I4C8R5_9PROT|nr:SPFH domain-containing protein [Falsiroseomonas stagni]SFK77030.1 Regulator of protease activity HflC, stomatin/prohibitin superfamily [Falsiroseomonas stagni DSM 19981]
MPEIPLATIILAVIVILAVITVAKGVRTVPQGEVWSVERFGAFTRLLQPGLNLIIPYVDGIGRKLNVQEVVLDIPEQSVITKDNASVAVDGIVYYRVMDPAKAAYAVQDLKQALVAMAMTNIRAVIGEMDLDQTLSSRDRINTSLLTILDGATESWGAKVSRVEIRKIEPPENLIRAMNLQMTAERERRASVAKAEGDKQALVLQAEGRRDSALRDAEAREALAQAEANATRMVAEAAAGAGSDALRYFIAQQYVKAFEALAANPSSKLVVVPMESASLAGGITQAMELLRASHAGTAPPAAPPPAPPPPAPPAGGTLPGVSPWTRG